MKGVFPSTRIFKSLSLTLLIFGLVASSCSVKQSIQKVFNVENSSSYSLKSISSCQFVSLQSAQKSEQTVVKTIDYSVQKINSTDQIAVSAKDQLGSYRARSVPLYILYKQLRTSLV